MACDPSILARWTALTISSRITTMMTSMPRFGWHIVTVKHCHPTVHYSTPQYTVQVQYKYKYSTVQYSTAQHSTVQYSTVHDSAVHYSIIQYTTVHYTTLQYTTLQYTALHYMTLQYITVQYTTVHYSTLQYITVQCTTIQYNALHCTTLHHRAPQDTALHYSKRVRTHARVLVHASSPLRHLCVTSASPRSIGLHPRAHAPHRRRSRTRQSTALRAPSPHRAARPPRPPLPDRQSGCR